MLSNHAQHNRHCNATREHNRILGAWCAWEWVRSAAAHLFSAAHAGQLLHVNGRSQHQLSKLLPAGSTSLNRQVRAAALLLAQPLLATLPAWLLHEPHHSLASTSAVSSCGIWSICGVGVAGCCCFAVAGGLAALQVQAALVDLGQLTQPQHLQQQALHNCENTHGA
jgi:hypothetical protein